MSRRSRKSRDRAVAIELCRRSPGGHSIHVWRPRKFYPQEQMGYVIQSGWTCLKCRGSRVLSGVIRDEEILGAIEPRAMIVERLEDLREMTEFDVAQHRRTPLVLDFSDWVFWKRWQGIPA